MRFDPANVPNADPFEEVWDRVRVVAGWLDPNHERVPQYFVVVRVANMERPAILEVNPERLKRPPMKKPIKLLCRNAVVHRILPLCNFPHFKIGRAYV